MNGAEWSTAITDWTTWLRAQNLSSDTIALRIYHVQRFANDYQMSPWDATLDGLAAWIGSRLWQPNTARAYRASLCTFYRWAHVTGRIQIDPAARLPRISVPRSKPRPAPWDTINGALAKAGPREQLMVLLALHEGMRRGEVARAHTRDLMRERDTWSLRIIGKGGHVRNVPLIPPLARELRELPAGYVFPGQINGHLSPHYVGKLVSRLLEGPWSMHTLRHRFATDAHASGVGVFVLQELLGHASPATTRIYTDVPQGALEDAVLATWQRAA